MKHAAVTKKPVINTDAALQFASGSIKSEVRGASKGRANKAPQQASGGSGKARIFFAPEGDKRLTINLRDDLHKRLKIAAIEKELTAGEIIEQLIERHL